MMNPETEEQFSAILNSFEKDQLNKYINDEEALEVLIKTLDQHQAGVRNKENLKQANKLLAESNLKKQPELDEAKLKLSNAVHEFEAARKEYMETRDAYEAVCAVGGNMSLQSIYNLLQTSSQKAEEETDKSADDFFCEYNAMHTEEEINLFQKQFLENRTQAHIKKIKAEKMKELLPNNY